MEIMGSKQKYLLKTRQNASSSKFAEQGYIMIKKDIPDFKQDLWSPYLSIFKKT